MIANGFSYGGTGYVILEEGEIDPATYGFIVKHYLVSRPDGSTEPGAYSLEEAKAKIDTLMKTK
ncbi:hypothetical protein A9Q99_01445 [Gammaproteobacteria bacterium 45_16_T64]|nr:hypothetical protein A9Q99_01445 [Gammaproteobacteria bacterium 45_16_T64]